MRGAGVGGLRWRVQEEGTRWMAGWRMDGRMALLDELFEIWVGCERIQGKERPPVKNTDYHHPQSFHAASAPSDTHTYASSAPPSAP